MAEHTPGPEQPTCGTCPYWEELDYDEPVAIDGKCRRYPPPIPHTKRQQREAVSVAGRADGMFHGWFPVLQSFDWCGEHPDFPAYLAARRAAAPNPRED